MNKKLFFLSLLPFVTSCSSWEFHSAVANNYELKTVKATMGAFTNVNESSPITGKRPLQTVQRKDVLEFLLNEGAKFKDEDYSRFIANGNFDCASVLRARGATLSRELARFLLEVAYAEEHEQKFVYIFPYAKFSSQEKADLIARLYANDKAKLVHTILELPPILKNDDASSCLRFALSQDDILSAKRFLEQGAKLSYPEKMYFLGKNIRNKQNDLVELFLEKLPGLKQEDKNSLLWLSLAYGNLESAKALSELGGILTEKRTMDLLALSICGYCPETTFDFVLPSLQNANAVLSEFLSPEVQGILKKVTCMQSLLEMALDKNRPALASKLKSRGAFFSSEKEAELLFRFARDATKCDSFEWLFKEAGGKNLIEKKSGMSLLATAIYGKNSKSETLLRKHNLKLNDGDKPALLVFYVKENNLTDVKKIVKENVSVNTECGEEKWSAAMWAVWNNNPKVAPYIMNSGGHLSDSQKNRLLERAVREIDLKRAESFISLGGDVNYVTSDNLSLLTIAGLSKNTKMFDLLKSRGANIEKSKKSKNGLLALETILAQKLIEDYPRVAVFLPDAWEDGFIALAKDGKNIVKKENVSRPRPNDDSNPLQFALAGAMLGGGLGGFPSETYTPGRSTYYEGGGGSHTPGYWTSTEATAGDVVEGMMWGAIIGGLIDLAQSGERERKQREAEAQYQARVAEAQKRYEEICAEIPKVQALFIDYGIDVNLADTSGVPVLAFALKSNQIGLVNILLEKGADATVALKYLIEGKEFSCAEMLIPTVDLLGEKLGNAFLKKVVENSPGSEKLIKEIVDRGGNAIAVLKSLCAQKSYSNIGVLMPHIQSVRAIPADSIYGNSVLHDLIQAKSQLVSIWLDKEAEVDALNRAGETPLHFAVRNNDAKIVEILCKKNCNVNKSFPNGDSPLHLAVEKGNIDMVKVLCAAGADRMAKDSDGRTPAQRTWNSPEIMRILNTKQD